VAVDATSIVSVGRTDRGVDVGAKREIYELMNEWTKQGIAILLVTSEMSELLAMSDRILVMHRGRVTAEFSRGRPPPTRCWRPRWGGSSSNGT